MPPSDPRRAAPPARLFFGVITGIERLFDAARERLALSFGPLEPGEESPVFPFPVTRTYGRTMGPGPHLRKFFFLRQHWPQDGLLEVKVRTVEIEEEIRAAEDFPVARPINIDPGLLNDCRIILASTKDHAHRIYRGSGVWEEVTLIYRDGGYQSLPWTYPDFRSPAYAAFFAPLRERYLESLRRVSSASGRPPPPAPSPLPPA